MSSKKKDSSLRHLLYALKQIWEADKLLLVFTLFKNSIEQVFYVFFFVYLTKYIFNCIENNIEYSRLFWFLVIACSGHICIHFICGWYETYRKIKTPEVYRHIFHRVIDLSDTLELKDYESPEFYDKYARALDNCVDQAMNIAIKTGVYIGNVISTIMSIFIAVMVDPVFLVFLIVPMIVSLYFGKKNARTNFEREKAITRDKRTAEYVKRVYYEKKYVAEVRLYDVNDLMLKKQEDAVDEMERVSLGYRMKTAFYSFIMKGSYSIFAGILAYFYVVFRVTYGNVSDVSSYVAMITAMSFSTNQLKAAVENRIYIFNESKLFENLEEFLEQDRKPKEEKIVLNEIESGQILVNGIDIKDIDLDAYRDRFGTVFQDLQVFAMTLAENVLMRRPAGEEDYEKVRKALQDAQFDCEHRGLTKGLDTVISREFDEEGFVPSGGQAQKIAIARVFASQPDMVILDEPSSALDPLAEYNMYRNMMKLSEGKGVIFISHRLSSARMADKIYLVKDGKIVEQGTHEQMMDLNGFYHEMFMLQAENYQDSLPEEIMKGAAAFYG